MVINHKLTFNGVSTTIEEPIGFDDLKTKIKRSDLHGMSVELSVGDLEFYGKAFEVIKSAYEEDVDSQIVYTATSSSGEEIYSGTIDLSTYSEKCGDYCSISCKVGDVGARTTFNSRTETEVDLNTSKTIDGDDLEMQASWNNIAIPLKHLKYTNSWKATTDELHTTDMYENNDLRFVAGTNGYAASFGFKKTASGEFGDVSTGFIVGGNADYRNSTPLFTRGDADNFKELYGENTTFDIVGNVKIRIDFLEMPTDVVTNLTLEVKASYYWGSINQIIANKIISINQATAGSYAIVELPISMDSITIDSDKLMLYFFLSTPIAIYPTPLFVNARFNITILSGSYLKMIMFDNLTDSGVSADMINVHNAMNVIAGAISENALSVKSDWYGGMQSKWNAPATMGGGHLKAITNGYKIRGLFTEGDTERNMPLSFKDMINSLNALDCIGWGFSKEDGVDYVRVERWGWFYKDDVILQLSGANEITNSVDTSHIYTDLQIGFKKYETSSQFNSIDSVHGERSMKNAIKVVSKKISKLCAFIGDTYCIEETRRAKEQVDPTDEFKYDENIFIFELGSSYLKTIEDREYKYRVVNNISASSGIDRPSEQYNIQLSPRRCAERWRSFLFACSNSTPYRFISGKINYKPSFTCYQNHKTRLEAFEYLADFMGGQPLAEDAKIEYSKTIFKAEKIKFTYPISLAGYKAIMANPYGQIEIDGIKGWIQEMQYSFATGEAEFTLIRKNT